MNKPHIAALKAAQKIDDMPFTSPLDHEKNGLNNMALIITQEYEMVAEVLNKIQFVPFGEMIICPVCVNLKSMGHKTECKLAKALQRLS